VATPTYTLIDSTTLTVATTTVTFSSIPQTYRDLVLVCGNVSSNSAGGSTLRFSLNNDNNANYDAVWMYGDGTTTDSDSDSSNFYIRFSVTGGDIADNANALLIINLMDYSQTDKHTTALVSRNDQNKVLRLAGRWKNTAAVTQIDVKAGIAAGATFHLYGIEA